MTRESLITPARWFEIGRVVAVGIIVGLFYAGLVPLSVLIVGVAFGLYPLAKTGLVTLVRERRIGTEVFVTIATTIAMLGGEYVAGAILMVIILIAELIAELNTERARASIRGLIGTVPTTVRIRRAAGEVTVPTAEVRPGDVVIVKAGEKIPVDGVVAAGDASVNQAPITGESIPQEKTPGTSVFAGTIVELGALDITTRGVGADTTFARIVALVESAEEQRAPIQRLADRVASWLIPGVAVFLVIVWFVTHDLKMIITLLIFTSPAELGLATPLVVIAAIARAARSGILLKGGVYLEELAKVTVIAFDKTGTVTIGEPAVTGVDLYDTSMNEADLLKLAAAAERRSSHPLANAIVAKASALKIDVPEPTTFSVVRGRGIRATVSGRDILAGNAAFLAESGISLPADHADEASAVVYIATDGRASGAIRLADELRPGAREAIAGLRASGIKRIVMLTGDNAAIANKIGSDLGVDTVMGDLLPEDKVAAIEKLKAGGARVAMVGDGINDAPALAAAHVGIAMGAAGTQAAIEAADVALMTNDLSRITMARAIARKAYRTIQENLIVGVGVVHVLGIIAALMKWIGPIEAAFIHLGPDILVFLNSIKLLRVRIDLPVVVPSAMSGKTLRSQL